MEDPFFTGSHNTKGGFAFMLLRGKTRPSITRVWTRVENYFIINWKLPVLSPSACIGEPDSATLSNRSSAARPCLVSGFCNWSAGINSFNAAEIWVKVMNQDLVC